MNLTITTAPAAEPVTLAELRTFCRIDTNDSDTLLESLGTAAREYVEQAIGKTLVTTEYRLLLEAFPSHGERIELPRPPLQSVEDVSYIDRDGNTVAVPDTDFTVSGIGNLLGLQPHLSPKTRWPSDVADQPDAVQVTYKAGYGDDAADVPKRITLCIKALTAWWFEQREPGVVGSITSEPPNHVSRLLNSAKAWLAA